MNVIGIIPARYASSRFPGKPLVDIGGKTMIQRVYEQAAKTPSLTKVIVATDDDRIFNHVKGFGGVAVMTQSSHQSGTERCAEVAALYSQPNDIIINIQGDEPFIQPKQIEKVISILAQNDELNIATLAKRINNQQDLFTPNIVKVIFTPTQKAIYFSRQVIPYIRDVEPKEWLMQYDFYKHIGLYGYRSKTLIELAQLSLSTLEQVERLEQLRWLENDYSIGIATTELETIGIDTPEDLEKVKELF